MTFDIFRVDWILVDSIIIIILIIILISVKFYKFKHRWRKYIANDSISKIILDPRCFQLQEIKSHVKKWNFLYNPMLKEIGTQSPTIFVFSSKSLHYLPYAILEGLCSYGFSVNHIIIKKKRTLFKKKQLIFDDGDKNFITLAFEHLERTDYKINHNYWIIDFKSYLSFSELHSDLFKQNGLVLINPLINQYKYNLIHDWIHSDTDFHVNLFFSKKSYLWFRNRKIAKFMKFFSQSISKNINIDVLEAANVFFKNNETILLAKLIAIIQNNSN